MTKAKIEKYMRSADMGDNAASTFVNYGVKKKVEGKYKIARILMVCGYVAFALSYFMFFVSMNILPVIALLPVFTWIITFFTWRYVSIEYEYYILDGEFRLLEVFGSKSMRELCRVRISAMEMIAPYKGSAKIKANAVDESARIYGVSTMENPDIYFAIFNDKDGTKRVVFFEATEKTLKVIKYYNSDVEVVKTTH
ncbi:MAG: hypothetical protein IJ428_04955 [Clostridia bacterium]|nr:hypothetical protein [Clostridia bacterium]